MHSVHPPPGETDRVASHVGSLTEALETERHLLEELARVLVAQRRGVSTDDLEALDESVFAAHRVFRTLQEARQRRRTLLELVGADADIELRELESVLGPDMTEELGVSRDQLLGAAKNLARELAMNRRVIDGAMAVGGQLLEIFVGGGENAALYERGSESSKGGNAGALLNTRV